MRAMITSTDELFELNGQPVRLWRGTTAGGIPFLAFIARVAVDVAQNAAEFDAELRETAAPTSFIAPPLSAGERAGLLIDARTL